MNKMTGPIGLMLMGATFICFCIVLSASAADTPANLPDLQSELKQSGSVPFGHPEAGTMGQLKTAAGTINFPWSTEQNPNMQHHLRDFMPRSLPSKEKIALKGPSSEARVSDLKAINSVKQRDINYDEAQSGDPASQGLANSLDVSITGQKTAKNDGFGKDESGNDIEKIVDNAFNNGTKNKQNDGKTAKSVQLGNNMNINVNGITVSAINTVEGGSAVATSNIVIKPVQILNPKYVIGCIRCAWGVAGHDFRVVQDLGEVTNWPLSRTTLDKRDHRA
jgi:hypothetical protein